MAEGMMDKDLLKRRVEALTESVLFCWEKFSADGIAPVLRARYGEHIIVVGVEFAIEDDDKNKE